MGTAYRHGPKQAALHVGHLHTGSGDLCRVSQGAGKTEGKRGRLRPETLNTGEKANAVSRGAAVWPESPLCPDEDRRSDLNYHLLKSASSSEGGPLFQLHFH